MQTMQKPIKNLYLSYSQDNLIIKAHVVDLFRKYEQKPGDTESGGILMGYIFSEHNEITTITTPGKLDRFGKFFFIRSKMRAQSMINSFWKKSKGTEIYLGEWHTHAQYHPKPSFDDRAMIKKVLKETLMEIDFLYLIIVGLNDTYWVGKQTTNGLVELRVNKNPVAGYF
jgi:integrative and conjugative element protein (TIGR02256 family)